MLGALKSAFRPEFLNRVDETVVFRKLGIEDVRRIASLLLEEIKGRMAALGITLTFSDAAVALVAQEGYEPAFGARPLKRAVIRLIEEPLATEMLLGRIREGDTVEAQAIEGSLRFEKV